MADLAHIELEEIKGHLDESAHAYARYERAKPDRAAQEINNRQDDQFDEIAHQPDRDGNALGGRYYQSVTQDNSQLHPQMKGIPIKEENTPRYGDKEGKRV